MLTMMRNMLRSPAAGGLFLLLIVAMAAWGVTDIFGGGAGNNLVAAGNRTLSDQQFDNVVERQLRNATDDRGRAISKEQALERGDIDAVFQRQQFDLLLRAYADRLGMTASQNLIRETITDVPAFRDTTDVFDPALLRSYLRQEGFSQKSFEDQLEADLTIARLQRLPVAGLKAPKSLGWVEAAYEAELRSASWFILPKSALPEIDPATDADLQTLYEQRRDALRVPERRDVSVIRLSPDDYMIRAIVEESDLEAFYEAYKPDRYTGPGTRGYTEFLFPDEDTARSALGRIAGGAEATELETLISASAKSGGPESIENTRLSQQVFSAASIPGSLHGPVEAGTNWMVIRLESITPGEVTPFEDVRRDIYDELAREQAIGFYYQALPRFDDLIGTGASLEEIATELGAFVETIEDVDRRGLTADGQIAETLIEAEGMLISLFDRTEGETTERLGTDEVTYLARVDTIKPERLPPLEEVKDQLAEAWIAQQEFDQLQTAASEVEARLVSNDSTLTDEAARFGAVVQSLPRPIPRTTPPSLETPPAIIASLFDARQEGEIMLAPSSPEAILVLRVDTIDRPAPETLALLADSTTARLQQQLNEDLFQAFFIDIQSEIELTVNQSAFAAYKRQIAPQQ